MLYAAMGSTAIMIGSRVYGRDGYVGTLVGTRERTLTRGYVLVRLGGLFGRWRSTRVVPGEWVAASERADQVQVQVDRVAVARCPHLRSDAAILAEATRRVRSTARARWTRDVEMSVRDGIVGLRCYPRDEGAIKRATEAVQKVVGVVGVEEV